MTPETTQQVPKLKAALILDHLKIKRWQAEALDLCSDIIDIELILNCENTKIPRNYGKNFIYYVISLLCLKGKGTRSITFPPGSAKVINFESEDKKGWQNLSAEIISEFQNKKYDLVIKFGMNLLTLPENLETRYGVFSFHHGDPSKYRGRPAGFYELLNNEDKIGIIVQQLSNKLDGGAFYAKAFSKIWHHSYKNTASHLYENSTPLLRKAIRNALDGEIEANNAEGKNYTLPDNFQALNFLLILLKRKLSRIFYGLFKEKKWNILICHTKDNLPTKAVSHSLSLSDGIVPEVGKKYTFYADPFFSSDGSKIYVEALNKLTGLGEIISLNIEDELILKGNHFSYPQSVHIEGNEYIFPETSNFTSQHFIKLQSGTEPVYEPVIGLEPYRLIDATYFQADSHHFIFASESNNSIDNLLLFYSETRLGPYVEHPMNPIVIDPTCARMAGSILKEDGKLFRFGQNNSFGYGQKLWLCEICELTPSKYAEKKIKEVKFGEGIFGPHTINFNNQHMVMDFYTDKFSIAAGFRRFLNLINKK